MMSDKTNNPFILPGLGQATELSSNPLLASMEMMRQAWADLTGPGGLASNLPLTPVMNVEELDRRIAELRTVENWLRMNLSMLSSTIQGMEIQRSTVSTLRAFAENAAQTDLGVSPLEALFGLKPASTASDAGLGAQGTQKPGEQTKTDSQASIGEQMGAASNAWWKLLEQQFNQLASATAATLPVEAGGAAPASSKPSATSAKVAPQAARKPATKVTAAKTASQVARQKKAARPKRTPTQGGE